MQRSTATVTQCFKFEAHAGWASQLHRLENEDEQLGQWISDAEVAEIAFTAFASKPKARRVGARLIVRRVRDQNPKHVHVNAQMRALPDLAPPRRVH